MTDRPLAESQKRILVALLEAGDRGETPGGLATKLGLDPVYGGRGQGGRGRGSRTFNPAQRLIPALIGLRNRGLTRFSYDLTRGNYPEKLTSEGEREARKLCA